MDDDMQEGGDPAEAFDRLRAVIEGQDRELALLRRAVEGLATERAHIDVPDYSETLGRMQQGVDATADRIAVINDVIARSPALAMTPEQMAGRITAAASASRQEDRQTIATARTGLEDVTRQLHGYVISARRGDEQNRWLAVAGVVGMLFGMVLWATLAGPIARALPASWQWPERMAARTLDMPMWEGGQRMMQSAAPDAFANIAAGDRIVTANRVVLEACRKRANRAHKTVRCTVNIEASEETR